MPERSLQETWRRYRAPEEDGAVLVCPQWRRLAAVLATNQARLSEAACYDCQGKRLGELRRLARQELLQQARLWTSSYLNEAEVSNDFFPQRGDLSGAGPASESHVPANHRSLLGVQDEGNNRLSLPDETPSRSTDPSEAPAALAASPDPAPRSLCPSEGLKIILAGHQPQLFHPGVWLKNFALDRLARRRGAVAINLIVDHDTPHTMQIKTPTGTVQQPGWVEIPLDGPAPPIPYEDRPIVDWPSFEAFGPQVCEALSGLIPAPMLREFWPTVVQRARAAGRLGAALAQGRHLWEIRWGNRTLETPFGRLCQGEAFLWFAAHLLARLPWFHHYYNGILLEYRQAYRIRNPAQPVPNLRAEDGWLESPLWIWTAQEPIRRPVFVRRTGQETILSDRAGLEERLPIRPEADLSRAVARLQQLAERGVRLRPKALLTTLWARLALGDLFVHGVGGARYDQITNELIRRWMGLEPPEFLVLTGTLYLPAARPEGVRQKWLYVQKQLRDLAWHPEWFLNCRDNRAPAGRTPPCAEDPEALAAEKRRWIQTPASPENARIRFLAIRRINQALQTWLTDVREKLLAEQAAVQAQLQAEKILRRRDWPFCYYPEETLREFFTQALRGVE